MSVARLLRPSPPAFVDARTRRPAFGASVGRLPAVRLAERGLVDRIVRRKKWLWTCLSGDDLFVAFAIVRTGYASTAFAFAFDVAVGRMLVDHAFFGPPPLGRVADDVSETGVVARFARPGAELSVVRARERGGLAIRLRARDLEVDARLVEEDAPGVPAPLAVIADLGAGDLDATEKRALLPVRGHARVGARRFMLDGGVGGYDYTHGLLPRHTRWRWAYGLGTTDCGEPVAFNVTAGFVGEAECAVFGHGGVHGIGEPSFRFDASDPLLPWTVRGDGVDLVFTPAFAHAERTRLGIVRSDFVQPVGTFTGTVELGGRALRVSRMPGVVEDQDVVW